MQNGKLGKLRSPLGGLHLRRGGSRTAPTSGIFTRNLNCKLPANDCLGNDCLMVMGFQQGGES